MRIGIDFDNTLANYDSVFTRLAQEWGLIAPDALESKQVIRQLARQRDELLWQRMQGVVYGQRMQEAEAFAGVDSFLRRCATSGMQVFIVSHKTQFGHFDQTHTDLREAARLWMRNQGFFDAAKYAIPEPNLFFESTQAEKVLRIARLQCDVFIDDLPELFEHPAFPEVTRKILFSDGAQPAQNVQMTCAGWSEIEAFIFGN